MHANYMIPFRTSKDYKIWKVRKRQPDTGIYEAKITELMYNSQYNGNCARRITLPAIVLQKYKL